MSRMDKALSIQSELHYRQIYEQSLTNNDEFWSEQAQQLDWSKPFTKVNESSYKLGEVAIKWFADGKLNVCNNCVDRHLATKADKTAIIWEPDDPNQQAKHITFKQLHIEVCKAANALQQLNIKANDRVILYMPMIPELAILTLACARIGAIHSVVFGGFSAQALAQRIDDCGASLVITANAGVRGNKLLPLQQIVNSALKLHKSNCVKNTLVVKYLDNHNTSFSETDIDYEQLIANQSSTHIAPDFAAEHPLFILYTSGSTGTPKGLLHSSGGYLTYAATTHKYVFDIKDDDIYWCTADIGWITGHSYLLYAPLANGCTTLMFEGVPNYPDLSRFGKIIDRHKVSIFYTAPTAIRTLIADAATALTSNRNSLRILGTVGEPINPEVWKWFDKEYGNGNCKIVDTWWQTETGGHLITPLPNAHTPKPGSAMQPFFGIKPVLIASDSKQPITTIAASGHLAIESSWPGQARTIWGNHQRFEETYFSKYPGYYFSGDGAKRDADGDYWITGRVDDVLNISGHRLGTAEIESAAVAVDSVAEAAVVGVPHKIKGEAIFIYAIANNNVEITAELTQAVVTSIRKLVGPIASPEHILWCQGLPKTRSGKIMRRILRNIAAQNYENQGDISTLADPEVVQHLIKQRKSLEK